MKILKEKYFKVQREREREEAINFIYFNYWMFEYVSILFLLLILNV